MVFTDDKSSGDIIYSQDWDDFVDFTEAISSNAYKFSGNARNLFYPSSLGKGVSGAVLANTLHSAATHDYSFITSKDGATDVTAAELEELTDASETTLHSHAAGGITGWQEFVSGSGIGGFDAGTFGVSGDAQLQISVLGYTTISGNARDGQTFSSNAKTMFPGSSNVNKAYLDNVSSNAEAGVGFSGASDIFDSTAYVTSTNALSNFTGSSNVNKAYLDNVSSNAEAGVGFSGASDIFTQTNYITSANALANFTSSSNVNKNYLDNVSSNAEAGVGFSGASDIFDVDSYITSANIIANYIKSTNAISRFADSSSTQTKWYPSSLGNGVSGNVKILDDWYKASAQSLSDFKTSGDEYSKAYASAQIAIYDSADTSSQVTLASGLASSNVLYHDADASLLYLDSVPQSVLKSGSEYWKAYQSGQIASYGATVWNFGAGGIYYSGEVSIGHSGFDIGDYNFQVSGDSYFSGNVTFKGSTFSGLAAPTFNSGAANKKYVDTVSGNILTNTMSSANIIANYVTSANALTNFRGSTATGEFTNSGVIWNGSSWVAWKSGTAVFDATSYITSSNAISRFADSSSTQTKWYPSSLGKGISSQVLSLTGFSSNTALVKNGFASVNDGGTIAHGLGQIPTYASIVPSGNSINFGTSCKVDSSNITVSLTAAGSRDVYWSVSV